MLFRSHALTGNSSEPKQRRDAPLHRDAPRHHRHHDVSAADGRRPRHAHVARQHSNALQAAGGSNCQWRLALPVTMAASELLCRAHSSSAQRSRPPVTSPRRLHPARGGRHLPGSPPLPLSLPPPSPSASSPPPGLIRGVQRPPRTNMGTHLGIADPPAPCRRRRRPCRPRFHPLALLPTPSGRQQKHADRTLRTSPSCSRQAWLAACWGVVFVCVVYSLSTQCIVSEQDRKSVV